jgi:hypothetical protein
MDETNNAADDFAATETPALVPAAPAQRSEREQRAFELASAWFEANCRHGAVARDTDAYNQMTDALPDLVKRIVALS